jgi:electron transport complex protein RnfD
VIRSTPGIMAAVLGCLVPGTLAMLWWFGPGVARNLALAAAVALLCEGAVGLARTRAPTATLRDGSALVTATLIALALPPDAGVHVVALAVASALLLGKAVYGGLGANPFNPAMVGYAIVLVSFPAALAAWPAPGTIDGIAAATPLEVLKHRGGATIADVWTPANGFGAIAGAGWEWINLGFLAGGIVLVALRVADWRIPLAMLATLTILAAVGDDSGSSRSHGSPAFHLFSGATMLGAFFIATDPVTCPGDARGRVAFGALIGALVYLLRTQASYPDGLAFAVLLANGATPLLARRSP